MLERLFRSKLLWLFILIVAVFYLYNKKVFSENSIDTSAQVSVAAGEAAWWNENYGFRRKITLNSTNKYQLVGINHSKLIIDSKSNYDGSDFKVIATDGKEFNEIPFELTNPDSLNTSIAFDSSITNYKDFYLYYGNKSTTQTSVLGANTIKTQAAEATIADEVTPVIYLNINNSWVLKEKSGTNLTVNIFSTITYKRSEASYYYRIDNQEYTRIRITDDIFKLDLKNQNVGPHTVDLYIQTDKGTFKTNKINFTISAPVYVAWTIDWEGIDPKPEYLGQMEAIANEYTIPMTQFFNPRVLIHSGISKARKEQLISWLKMRQAEFGDEIGMHMHMQHDMVEFAGVTPKEKEQGWDNDTRGYDLPSTVYDYADYLKLLQWGKSTFVANGLPEPKGYRAGGWFADLDNLKAMEDAGFAYDTSARQSFKLGQSNLVQAWTLNNTAQPYYPSYADQNTSDPNNSMKLLEIPNNGADSYWSNTQQLIDNFYLNYTPGTFLDKDVLVVYLSHPEWFNIDDPKLRILYTELNKYRYEFNKGPVKFVTLEEYMKESVRL